MISLIRWWHGPAGAALLAMLVAGCSANTPAPRPSGQPAKPAASSSPTPAQVANATLTGILPKPITLHDGRYVGEPAVPGAASRPTVQLVTELEPTGDLDGDGVPETVAVLVADTGGSGTFVHLAPLGACNGKLRQFGAVLLGDRIQIRSIRIANRIIDVETVEAGPGDAMCCPTAKRQRLFALRDGVLAGIATKDEGKLSLSDLAGPEWVLTAFGHGEPAPAMPELTLRVDAAHGTVSGSSGCNRYTGTITSPAPGELRLGPLAGTRRMCPPAVMKVERRFFQALGGASGYRFSFGRLAIDSTAGGRPGTLLFTARHPKATAGGTS